MNNRVNYALVGFLVLVGMSLIMGFSYWMLRPSVDSQVQKYTIYFNESVLGLNIDAPVKYRGISVGKVKALKINPKNSKQVQVTVSILKTTPVKTDTLAKLTAQGITGLTYINLSNGGSIGKALALKEGEKYPVIKTAPSFFENFEKSLGSVSTQLTSTLGRTEQLLGEDNQREIARLLIRSASVMDKLDVLLDEKTIKHMQSTVANVDSFSKKLDNLTPNVDKFLNNSIDWENKIHKSLDSISVSYLRMGDSMDAFKASIKNGDFNLKELSAELIPTMNNSFLQMQSLMIELKDMMQQYNASPSDILYKSEEIKKAPGEI